MTKQIDHWRGAFGDAYTERNKIDWQDLLTKWQEIIGNLELQHVVEVGPNRGHNLRAFHEIGVANGNLIGVELNQHAIQVARTQFPQISVLEGNVFELPFVDAYADLVFTSGVLIHIALADLPAALSEIYRVSGKYIIAVEYFAEQETTIHYRGHDDQLWKRDFKSHYLAQFPDLELVKEGEWTSKESHWWLFKK